MRIYLPDVRSKEGEAVSYKFDESHCTCFDDFPEGGKLDLRVAVSCRGDQVIVSGDLSVSVVSVCSRCLEHFEYCFETDFTEAFTVLKTILPDSSPDCLAAETANMLTVTGDYLYLDEYIRQLIILAQDYSPLCKADCRGICAGCGTDLNRSSCRCRQENDDVDIRLHKLKELSSGSTD
jgi:uncharacterized protein